MDSVKFGEERGSGLTNDWSGVKMNEKARAGTKKERRWGKYIKYGVDNK